MKKRDKRGRNATFQPGVFVKQTAAVGLTVFGLMAGSLTVVSAQETASSSASKSAADLSQDIETLQLQIESATEAERLQLESRQIVSDLLMKAQKSADAEDFDGAARILDEARKAAQPNDQATQNRITLAQVTIKIRKGDLSGASSQLSGLASTPGLSDLTRQRVDTLSQRIGKAVQSTERVAVIDAISSLSTETAIESARIEAQRDPGNIGLRLLLIDLLRKSSYFDEASSSAKDLIAEQQLSGDVDNLQRALLALGRVAVDAGDLKAAAVQLDALRRTADSAQKARWIADLEERIARQKAKNDIAERNKGRRVIADEIAKLTGPTAVERVRQAIADDPDYLPYKLALGDLLRKAKEYGEAQSLGEKLVLETAASESADNYQKSLMLLARIAIDRNDFIAAGKYRDEIAVSGDTPKRYERMLKLDEAITYQQTRFAEKVLAAKRKAVIQSILALQAKDAPKSTTPEATPEQTPTQ